MIPFRLAFRPGVPLYEQVVHAAKRAIVSGHMRPGDPFPSVRILSKELKINQNTAHKVIAELVSTGVLEVRVGVGTVVAPRAASTSADRTHLLKVELEQLVVEAKRLGLNLKDVQNALDEHWQRLGGASSYTAVNAGKGERE